MENYDPEIAISYLDIITGFLKNFKVFHSHSDISKLFGEGCITDITDVPEIKAQEELMNLISPLSDGYKQKIFQFKTQERYRGIFDVTFHGNKLVNFRGQLFFTGWFSLGKAIKFNSFKLRPLINEIIGIDNVNHDFKSDKFICNDFHGLVVIFGQINENSSVSTWITDKHYF